jgi:hypothetical protein
VYDAGHRCEQSLRQYILVSRLKKCRVGRRPMHVVRGVQERLDTMQVIDASSRQYILDSWSGKKVNRVGRRPMHVVAE